MHSIKRAEQGMAGSLSGRRHQHTVHMLAAAAAVAATEMAGAAANARLAQCTPPSPRGSPEDWGSSGRCAEGFPPGATLIKSDANRLLPTLLHAQPMQTLQPHHAPEYTHR